MSTEAIVVRDEGFEGLSVPVVVARSQKVQQVMQTLMKEGTHYGTIPGTPKPSLWQPGAEALMMTFQLAPELDIDDLSTGDAIRYRIVANIRHVPSQSMVGVGVGEASSDEEKFAWRKAVCKEEYDDTPEDRRRKKWSRDGKATLQVRTEKADIANTVLKMAKKRAIVDGAKSTCAASDIFVQDLEDLEHLHPEPKVVAPPRPKAAPKPAPKPMAAPPEPGEEFDAPPDLPEVIPQSVWDEVGEAWHDRGAISEKQNARLFAIAKGNGWDGEAVKALIEEKLAVPPTEIPWGDPYNKVVEAFQTFSPEG